MKSGLASCTPDRRTDVIRFLASQPVVVTLFISELCASQRVTAGDETPPPLPPHPSDELLMDYNHRFEDVYYLWILLLMIVMLLLL